jgi:hypothetical protein
MRHGSDVSWKYRRVKLLLSEPSLSIQPSAWMTTDGSPAPPSNEAEPPKAAPARFLERFQPPRTDCSMFQFAQRR